MKVYKLGIEKILEFNLSDYVSNDIIDYFFFLKENKIGQYDGEGIDAFKKSNHNGFQSTIYNFVENKKHIDLCVEPLFNTIDTLIKTYCDPNFFYRLNNYWFNINHKGSSNTLHNHTHPGSPQGGLSGVFYLSVPKNSGNIIFQLETKEQLRLKSISGYLIIFPLYLDHLVEESKSNRDRLSIAFNYDGILNKNKLSIL